MTSLTEPMLKENPSRFVIFPINYPKLWDMYKKHVSVFWTVEEIDLSHDINDWNNLTDNERHFISTVLAFFAASDGIVNENLAINFYKEIQIPEARAFYSFQISMEQIHAETYGLLVETYIKDSTLKANMFNAIETIPCVTRKANWALKWMNSAFASFAERLVAFAVVEGIFFSGSFCSIFWLKKRGLMKGLTQSNEFISRDEGLHCDFACLLFSMLENKPTADRVLEIVKEAVEIEKEFVSAALPVSLIGMNAEQMCTYIEYCADRLLVALGLEKSYKVVNPFDWMDLLSVKVKTNFFESRVSEYAKASVGMDLKEQVFSMTADF